MWQWRRKPETPAGLLWAIAGKSVRFMWGDRGIVRGGAFLLACLLGFPSGVLAQLVQMMPRSPIASTTSGEPMPQDFYIMPWIAGGVVYDDNVFFSLRGTPKSEDVFVRTTPGLQASYQSTPLTVIADYRFDAEYYSRLHELNTPMMRQFGTLELRSRPSKQWTVGNTFGYAQTNTPFELNLLTSAQVARFRADRYFANPNTEYRLDALNKITAQYAYSKDIFAREVEIDSHILNVGFEHRIGAHDTLGPGYVGRHFTFGGNLDSPLAGFIGGVAGSAAPFTSHALVLAWAHDFSADTRLEVRAGPRVSNGTLDNRPETFIGFRRRIQNGEVNLTYSSVVLTMIGTIGATRADTFIGTASYTPMKHLTLTVGPTVSWIENNAFTSTIYTGAVEAAYQLTKYLTAKGSVYVSYQEGNFLPVGGTTFDNIILSRNVFWLRLEFTYPSRWN